MKFAHILGKNKTTALPRNFIFVDTETSYAKNNEYTHHFLKLGSACFARLDNRKAFSSEGWLPFTKNAVFWKELDSFTYDKSKTLLYAHNTHFDFFVLDGITHLQALKWELKNFFINSNVFIMTWRKGSKKLVVLDSGNILKKPLASIGEALGVPKLEVDFDTVTDDELAFYCRRDTEILTEWIKAFRRFVREHDLGTYKHTIASQAFNAYRHRFMPCKIYVHNSKPVIELERKAYFGGRTEAFFLGSWQGEPFYLVDVNSMYPSVMRDNEYPVKFIKRRSSCELPTLAGYLKKYCVIATVSLGTDEPVFPLRDLRTIFPVGEFTTTLCTPELQYALDRGMITAVHELALYKKQNIFKEYVDFFYGLKRHYKEAGNDAMYTISKLFMNSLYGKFGQRSQSIKEIGPCDPSFNLIETVYDYHTRKHSTHYYLAGKEYIMQGEGESFNSFVAVAAHVTSYARLFLWRLICVAGVQNTLYMDTDSLLVNQLGFNKLKHLLHPTRLGALDLQKSISTIEIRGPKDYTFDDKTRIKGIKKNAKKLCDNRFEQEHFLKFRSMLRHGWFDHASVKTVRKTLKREYHKGIVQPSGRVLPYSLPEDAAFLAFS